MPLALLDTDTLSEIIHGLVLVTTNTASYARIGGLVLDRWTQP